MKRAYISCPMTVAQEAIDEAGKLAHQSHVDFLHWVRGTSYDEEYYKKTIASMDAFIIILPNIAWSCEFDKMTSGSRRELSHAYNSGVPIYLYYKSSQGPGLYATNLESSRSKMGLIMINKISGIASTKFNFQQYFNSVEESKAVDEIYSGKDFDVEKHINEESARMAQKAQEKMLNLSQRYGRVPNRIPQQGFSDRELSKIILASKEAGIVFNSKDDGVVEYKPDNRILLFF